MKAGLKSKFLPAIGITSLIIICSITSPAFAAEPAPPGWQMVSADPVSPDEARAFFQQFGEVGTMGAMGATGGGQAEPEITELARGLKYDPDLMYKFVHDHIEYTPYFGDLKGAYMTLMDRNGNSFDQSSLLIALLREAGYTANYVYGTIALTLDQTTDWLRVSNPYVLGRLIASAGIPCTPYIDGIELDHVWVKVNIDDTDYVFDPSMKSHSYTSGIDLGSVMEYNRTTFLDNATSGMESGTNYIRNVNKTNIVTDLATYSTNLIDYIKTNNPGATLGDIIGGKRIVPASEAPLRQTQLPYEQPTPEPEVWPDIPGGYKTTLQIQYRGIDVTNPSSDIYGRRLTIWYNPLDQPELRLDGELLATGTAPDSDITLTVDHPYPAGGGTYCDRSKTFSIEAGGSYYIVNGWSNTGTKVIEKHRMILEQRIYAGDDVASEPVLGESLTILGLTWLAECSQITRLSDHIANIHTINHHELGVCGQKESPYIDMPMGLCSLISFNMDTSKETPSFFASNGHASALEWGVIRQLQPDRDAVSTVKLLDIANDRDTYDKIFEATTANWDSVRTQLQGYDSTELSCVQNYIDNYYRVILPEYGDLGEDAWIGIGFLTVSSDEHLIGHIISGGYNGGYSTVQAPLSIPDLYTSTVVEPVDLSSESHVKSQEPIDMVTGSYLYEHTDLAIGSGDYPLSLELRRSYNSKNRLNDGPLGLGWTHNFDITAKVRSDGFQSMGIDSPIDAAPSIVQTYINIDLLCSDRSITNLMVAALSQRWLMDQMIDNIVTIKQPGDSMQFVKLPDGTYNPPPGKAAKLEVDIDGSFLLKDKNGNIIDFDTEGRICEWSDSHDNTVGFSYSGDKLTGVSNNNFGRSLTLHYSGDLIDYVEDSASPKRRVSFSYTSGNLTTVTDVEDEDTTFEYDPVSDGQLTHIYYPTDPVNPFVTNVYDGLGQVKQQTNANGQTYDYYYSYYRTEEQQPEETPPGGGSQRFSRTYYFDDYGNMVAEKDQLGRETTYDYGGHQRLKRVDYPTGNANEYSYDENHNITAIIKKPIQGSPEPVITEEFYYESYENDAGRWFNLLKWQKDTASNQTDYRYDFDDIGTAGVGNLTKITYPAVDLPGELGSFHPETSFTYYPSGQVWTEIKKITDSDSTKTTYEYYTPGHGGLKKTIVDDGGLDIVTEMTYDSVGNLETITDPRGNATTYEYYPSRRLEKETAPAPFNYETRYEYYPDGKPKLVKRQTENPDIWQITTCTYSPTGQKETVHGPIETTVGDSVGDNHGSIHGAEWTTGKVSGALSFNGSSDHVNCGNGSSLDLTDAISVAAWVNFDVLDVDQGIVDKGSGLSDGVIRLWFSSGNNNVYFEAPEGVVAIHGEPLCGFSPGVWYHILVTYDKDAGSSNLNLYINGANVASLTETAAMGTNNYNLSIGAHRQGTMEFFNGSIDEVLIFDRALLQAEIQQLHQNGLAGWNALTGFDPDKYPVSYWNFDEGQINLTRYEYDSLDRLWKITDGENNTTERLYYPDGKLWKIVDAKNQDSVQYTYNPDGTLYSMTDAKGNTTTYEYDGHIRLDKTTYPDPTKFEELSYDEAGRLNEKRTRADEIIGFDYDELNRLITKTVSGNSTTYEYDLLSRQINIIDNANTIHNDFDNAGRLKSVTYDYSSLDDKTVWYEYDAAGNRIELAYPDDGKYVRYHSDNLNHLVSICSDDIIGHWNFDKGEGDIAHDVVGGNHGDVEDGAVWTASGKIGSALDFTGNEGYVDLGEDTWSASDLASGTILAWVKIPDITSMTSNEHSIVDLEGLAAIKFNGGTDKFRSQLYDGSSPPYMDGTTTPENNTWYLVSLTWDGSTTTLYVNGNPENSGSTGSPVFDSFSRHSRIGAKWNLQSYFDGVIDEVMLFDRALLQEEIEAIYSGTNQGDGVIVRYAYDALSARISAQYGNGTSAEYYYDMADRLLSLDNQTNNENPSYDYSYDNVGNRLNMLVNGTDLHIYTYDNLYQLINVDYNGGSITSYYYDSLGNRTGVVDGNGVIGYWKMDDNADNTTVVDSSGNGNNGTFNDGGDPNTSAHHTSGKIGGALTFDGVDDYVDCGDNAYLDSPSNTNALTISAWVYPKTVSGIHGVVSKWAQNNRAYLLQLNSNRVEFALGYNSGGSYNSLSAAANLQTNNWYHIAGVYNGSNMTVYVDGIFVDGTSWSTAPSSTSAKVHIGDLEYSTARRYFNGDIDNVMIFDRALSPTEYSRNSLNQYTSVGDTDYSYDDNGNLTGDGTNGYTYDAENRLMTANASGLSTTYSYDPLGRRISKTVVGGETTTAYYIYDGDQVICEYDGDGNLRRKFLYGTGIDEVVRMSQVRKTADISGPAGLPDDIVDIYDLRKMSEAWLKNEGDAGFNADADLNYDEKINNTDSDILSANWLIDNPELSEQHLYYHYDGLGSVVAISNNYGSIVEKYRYDVYGNVVILTPINEQLAESKYGNPYMFTGRRFDTETGLYYYRARYYSTEIGRFLQVDPIGYADGLNLYAYCGNNPIVLIDPFGLCSQASPWQVGWEWLSGTGPRERIFVGGDRFTEMLGEHGHIQDVKSAAISGLIEFGEMKGTKNYRLSGLQGISKYVKDYSTLSTGGLTGNLAVTYLGSYNLTYEISNVDMVNGTAQISFHVWNTSTIASGTRPPVIGYTRTWSKHVEPRLNRLLSSGPMSRTRQDFYWTEDIRFEP